MIFDDKTLLYIAEMIVRFEIILKSNTQIVPL